MGNQKAVFHTIFTSATARGVLQGGTDIRGVHRGLHGSKCGSTACCTIKGEREESVREARSVSPGETAFDSLSRALSTIDQAIQSLELSMTSKIAVATR